MKKLLLSATAAIAFGLAAGSAHAGLMIDVDFTAGQDATSITYTPAGDLKNAATVTLHNHWIITTSSPNNIGLPIIPPGGAIELTFTAPAGLILSPHTTLVQTFVVGGDTFTATVKNTEGFLPTTSPNFLNVPFVGTISDSLGDFMPTPFFINMNFSKVGTVSGSASEGSVLPEPGTLAILGVGIAGLGLVRRRKA